MSANYKFDPEKVNYFASTNSRGKKVAFGIKAKDRLQHIYVIGKTGMGKSTMLENMAIQDILNDEGVCFIDPHGSSAERLLKYIPKHRIKDTLYFAPFDSEYPVAFNILEDIGFENRHLVVSGIMGIFKRIWKDTWSSRMEYILQNALLALLEYPNTTLLDVNRMLSNPEFRRDVLANISDPVVKRFWVEEFASYTDRYAQEATPAIQNKVGQFISNPVVRNIVGQSRSSFDLREFMDERKILIVNLAKGKLGELNADLLGSLLTVKLYLEAISRADQSEENLAPFYTYIDEFQSIVNDSFADILSEARKYRLSLTLAHQYIEQLPDTVRAAVFGNVGTTVSFRVGPKDAEVLESLFAPVFKAQDISSLAQSEVYLTLLIDGAASPPFSAKTLPPIEDAPYDFSEEIVKESRKQFARARAGVEEFILEIDKKRGAANLDKISDNKKESQDSVKTQVSPQLENTKDKRDNARQNDTLSPAEILRQEYQKEPQGFSGPKDLHEIKKPARKEKDKKQLKALLDKVLNKQSDKQKQDKEQSENSYEQISQDNAVVTELSSVVPDKSASKESMLERAAKLLDSLRQKGEVRSFDTGKTQKEQLQSSGPQEQAQNLDVGDTVARLNSKWTGTQAYVKSKADPELNIVQNEVKQQMTAPNTQTGQEKDISQDGLPEAQAPGPLESDSELSPESQDLSGVYLNMENEARDKEVVERKGDAKERLESVLPNIDKLSDGELKELLENLLKDDMGK